MASWQNGKLKKWQFEKKQVDKIARRHSGKLAKWQVDKMAS